MSDYILGFRFDPTDDELIRYFLSPKLQGRVSRDLDSINEVSVYNYDPQDLTNLAREKTSDEMWHFFSPLENKHSRGDRVNRETPSGRWRASGNDRDVTYLGRKIGTKKTLVFCYANQQATNWVLHEYTSCSGGPDQKSYVVCKLMKKED